MDQNRRFTWVIRAPRQAAPAVPCPCAGGRPPAHHHRLPPSETLPCLARVQGAASIAPEHRVRGFTATKSAAAASTSASATVAQQRRPRAPLGNRASGSLHAALTAQFLFQRFKFPSTNFISQALRKVKGSLAGCKTLLQLQPTAAAHPARPRGSLLAPGPDLPSRVAQAGSAPAPQPHGPRLCRAAAAPAPLSGPARVR